MRLLTLPCAVLFSVICCCNAYAQSVITIREIDQNNNKYDNKNNADINSQLVIRFDRAAFIRKVNATGIGKPLPPDAVNLLNTLYEATGKVDTWSKAMEDAVRLHTRGDKNSVPAFLQRTSAVAREITAIFDRDPATRDYFESYKDLKDIWGGITYALNKRISDLEQQLTDDGAYSDIRVQIGGWLMHNNQSSPLHFNGLDNNPQGEYYEVERWKFTLTDDQVAQLEQIQRWVRDSRQREMNVNEILKGEYVRQFTDILQQRLKADYEDFRKEAEKVAASLQHQQIVADIRQVLVQGEVIRNLLNEKIKYYQTLDDNTDFSLSLFLTRLQSDVTGLNSEFSKLNGLLTTLRTDIPAASPAVQQQCADLLALASGKISALATTVIPNDVLQFGAEERRLAELALRFSDKVFSLALGNIPAEATTDLLYSGYRTSGDRVVIKMEVTNTGSKRTLWEETHRLTLYRILAHVEATVGVIFAHPLTTTSIQKDVQMAPYYNVLFKGILGMSQQWKRTSSLPNNLLDLNFGLHVSSPDFDKDDVPELGLGIVASTLHDYLQVGWAYNLFYGANYIFVGFRLPIPTMSLGNKGNGVQ
ncbi:hypothetical protein [Chitinophaga rhizophila]|uniref:Uncharacterized protein n=1 Tax=Chitinophaga rhizophila TaxID=2866212 RepID=A0ABS7GJW0_9BACT|nr:hypothetical protein [Chitinophaga rhizophila]MBW8687410.1 hypothetical protein [Chitinophaga rhizophila]